MLPSYYDAIRPLPDEERLALYDAIMDYVFDGKVPEDLSPLLNGYFVLLRPNIDSSAKRYAASVGNGKKGGRPKGAKARKNPTETQEKPIKNQEKDKEREKEKDTDREFTQAAPAMSQPTPAPEKKSRSHFVPPTLDEVAAYCRERKNSVDAERFVDFYTSNGWMIGKNSMKDWRAAVRTWEKREHPGRGADKPYEYNPGDLTGDLSTML